MSVFVAVAAVCWGASDDSVADAHTGSIPAGGGSEPPSLVDAKYVRASHTKRLGPGRKIADLQTTTANPFVLQRLTQHTWWFARDHQATVFYVGDEGVLVFDPLEDRSEYLVAAIELVTDKPVTTIVYSHNHADHIGDAEQFVLRAEQAGIDLRIIASSETAAQLDLLQSAHPQPTETVAWPEGDFQFEDLKVTMTGFQRAAHSDDSAAWLLVGERVLHAPDLVNPDQLPSYRFGGSQDFTWYEANLEVIEKLPWTWFSGGHGNIGSREDFAAYWQFVGDLKSAVAQAMRTVERGDGFDAQGNTHAGHLPTAWVTAVGRAATDQLRLTYGGYYGFDATPSNAEMVAMSFLSYR